MVAKPTAIFPGGKLQSFLTVDFKKFYARILQNTHLYFNQPMIFKKEKNSFLRTSKNLPFNTFSNLLFSALEETFDGKFVYALRSREFRCVGLPQDCVIDLSPKNGQSSNLISLSYFGCFIHGCPAQEHKMGNLPKQTYSPCGLKPKLWTLPKGQSYDNSMHPLKKDMTYAQVYQKSM